MVGVAGCAVHPVSSAIPSAAATAPRRIPGSPRRIPHDKKDLLGKRRRTVWTTAAPGPRDGRADHAEIDKVGRRARLVTL
ncbi:hypothetical protein Arub01_16330 [Actinomadura rubrobrunea]|uniref:Uncharacterized protein n=1 Tax=Actinomadura rubrobrunea TaxID=115335 RepID=A0A9W6PRT3_9ACTN|nr:hypothetical protein Arub01_16330 [Actinomadura rubrobrunea]